MEMAGIIVKKDYNGVRYEYVVIDDRCASVNRDMDGNLIAYPGAIPHFV
ncbi:MAG: hypothetical protein EGR97_05220 [Clostridiales bacterium]|nr:hypothetical protein [Clostridiales bacterium]